MTNERLVRSKAEWKWISALLGLAVWLQGGNSPIADEADPPSTALTGAWSPRMEVEATGVAPFAVLTVEGWGNVAGGDGVLGRFRAHQLNRRNDG